MYREITFKHEEETYKFKIVNIEVKGNNWDKWVKTSGKSLNKFYKVDPNVTILKLPKSSKEFDMFESIDVNAPTSFQNPNPSNELNAIDK